MSSIKELKSDKTKFKHDSIKYVEVTNLLGHKYRELGRYDEAINEHLDSISICQSDRIKQNRLQLEAVSRRALGECYSEMGQHQEALNEHQIYLRLAEQCNDSIEIQRAHATIGRTYLLWGLELDDKNKGHILKKSKVSFEKALDLCERLMSSGKLKSPREHAEMKSRLLLNLGLVHENLYNYNQCRSLLNESIALTKSHFLYDELFRCQISMGSILERLDLFDEALCHYREALNVANLLKSKTKKFDSFVCLGLLAMKQGQQNQSRSFFKKAHFLRTSVEDDRVRVAYLLRVSMAIDETMVQLSKASDLDEKILLCDLLGDHFVAAKCFNMASKFYLKELSYATAAEKDESFLSNIYVSIGQTYLDDGRHVKALEYFQHEYNFRLGDISEQISSLLKMADIQECLYYTIDDLESERKFILKNDIIQTYETAMKLFNDFDVSNETDRQILKKQNKLFQTINKNYFSFLESNNFDSYQQQKLKDNLSKIAESLDDEEMNFEDEQISENSQNDDGYEKSLYDNYQLDLLSNSSDVDNDEDNEETPENFRSRPKRMSNSASTNATNRLNQFGETQLHTACIAGNLSQVERLVKQKAVVNIKDFCGWTPLHEAANHGFGDCVEFLLDHGADIESCDVRSDCITPLHDACQCGHLDIVRLLLKRGANVLARTANQETPLECLIGWRERSEITGQELDTCLAMENELMALMKTKGFDLDNLLNKKNLKSETNNRPQRSSRTSNRQLEILPRNLLKDRIYSTDRLTTQNDTKTNHNDEDVSLDNDDEHDACNEYRSTIARVKNFNKSINRKTNSGFRKKNLNSNSNSALIETEIVRDDWLIDDLHRKSKKRNKDFEYGNGVDTLTVSGNKKQKSNNFHIYELDDPEDDVMFVEEKDKLQSVNKLMDSPSESDFNQLQNEQMGLKKTNVMSSIMGKSVGTRFNEDFFIEEDDDDKNHHFRQKSNKSSGELNRPKSRKSVIVNFDDIHKSSFIVFIPDNQVDFRWLNRELAERYFSHYGLKPVFSLKTTLNNAIFMETDPVINILDSDQSIKAFIETWIVDRPEERYRELCTQHNLEFDEQIEAILRAAHRSWCFTARDVYFASVKHVTLMFQALFGHEIKKMDLSFSNALQHKECLEAFRITLSSFSTLEELCLSGIVFPREHLLSLILNLSLALRKLDLSFNPFGDGSRSSLGEDSGGGGYHVYSLTQVLKTYHKLEHLNLSGCDLGKEGQKNNLVNNVLFINAVESSPSLKTLLLDFNNLPDDFVERFKKLDVETTKQRNPIYD